jgi:CRISPR/Cas system CMR-associated protein Cmr3 (group 5 of RAMP superfamily)
MYMIHKPRNSLIFDESRLDLFFKKLHLKRYIFYEDQLLFEKIFDTLYIQRNTKGDVWPFAECSLQGIEYEACIKIN